MCAPTRFPLSSHPATKSLRHKVQVNEPKPGQGLQLYKQLKLKVRSQFSFLDGRFKTDISPRSRNAQMARKLHMMRLLIVHKSTVGRFQFVAGQNLGFIRAVGLSPFYKSYPNPSLPQVVDSYEVTYKVSTFYLATFFTNWRSPNSNKVARL